MPVYLFFPNIDATDKGIQLRRPEVGNHLICYYFEKWIAISERDFDFGRLRQILEKRMKKVPNTLRVNESETVF